MSNKIVIETRADTEEYNSIILFGRSSFDVSFAEKSKVARELKPQHKEKFKVTIERIK